MFMLIKCLSDFVYICMYGIKLLILEFLEISFFDNNFVMFFLFGKEENKFIEFIRFVN